MPPASASTGRPASSALVSVGAASGSTPTTRTFGPLELHAYRALPEQRLDLVIRVDRGRPGRGNPALARQERVGVALADNDELRTVVSDLLRLRR